MTQLTIITGDAPNALLAQLDADLAADPLPPFDDECIVVQSLGMERWVRQQLALRRGCAASLAMPFPAAFCRRLATALQREARVGTGAGGIDARFEEEALTWRLFSLLQDATALRDPVFAPLHAFLHGGTNAKTYGLARTLAGRFDEYRLYRPDLLTGWEDRGDAYTGNPHEPWQAALWRVLLGGERPAHFARWFTSTVTWLETVTVRPAGLPPRVSVFGVSTLPPLFVRLLRAVARFVPVRIYVLYPEDDHGKADSTTHPLFDAFGHSSRELLAELREGPSELGGPTRMHVRTASSSAATSATLLAHLQHSLRAGTTTPFTLSPTDRSLSVQVCHSPLRELEVLRDQLLDAFAADPTLRPHDVLVMAPDVEAYAPLAEAIFGHARSRDATRPSIPFRIADRTLARESAPAQALLALLALVPARLTAREVLELLTQPMVRAAAGIASTQLDQVSTWMQEAAIRWGVDGATRAAWHDVPSFEENSWRQGLDRLLAGYAVGRTDALVGGVLPVSGDLVGDTDLLGRFVAWVEMLVERLAALRTERPLGEWTVQLQDTLRWLVASDDADERAAIDRVAHDLDRLAALADGDGDPRAFAFAAGQPVSFEVIRDWVGQALATDDHGNGFLAGGLTLCAMKPMRAIPHRIIAMLGLDDRAYPRRIRRPAFDVIGSDPRRGDRDPRADDRQLVLDTLLSAGDRLILSYVGRSQRDNAEVAPSIVITELLDRLDQLCTGPVRPSQALRVEHRLQPFSPAYFTQAHDRDPRLFSFDARLAASVAGSEVRRPAPPFLPAVPPMPVLRRDWRRGADPFFECTIDDLIATWLNPSRLYCQRVLQLRASADDPLLEDIEPMTVDPLLRTRLQQRMLDRALSGVPVNDAGDRRLAIAMGELPPGTLGLVWHDRLQHEIAPLLRAATEYTVVAPRVVDVAGTDWRVQGHLALQLEQGQLRVRAGKLNARDQVRAWVAHVVRNACGDPTSTHVIARDQRFTLEPPTDAMAQLDLLVQGARLAQRMPLPYFLEAAAAFRKRASKGEPGLDAAREAFARDDEYGRGDITDPYVATLWSGRDPLEECAEAFVQITNAFWEPFEQAVRA